MHAKIAYLFLITIAALAIYSWFSRPIAVLVIVFTYAIFALRVYMPETDKFMHTKLFGIPEKIKCAITINCEKRSCLAKEEMESQANGDFDILSVGHVLFWTLATILEPKVTFLFVVTVSSMWEVFEAAMGCAGFVIHARITDILLNITGYAIGRFLVSLYT